jgi:hypothetical protein
LTPIRQNSRPCEGAEGERLFLVSKSFWKGSADLLWYDREEVGSQGMSRDQECIDGGGQIREEPEKILRGGPFRFGFIPPFLIVIPCGGVFGAIQ